MKKLSLIFYFYCLAVSIFIVVSGIISTRRDTSILPIQLVFLPIPLYFIIGFIRYLKNKKGKSDKNTLGIDLAGKGNLILLSVFILAILFMFGLSKIINK